MTELQKDQMKIYQLTEALRKTLLDIADADFNASMHELLASLPVAEPSTSPVSQADAEALAHRIATTYTHRSAPGYSSYAFMPHTLMDFVRAIEAAHGIKGDA